jgi:CelD/BcsL family acetyltransferase involved in cellulose biosynthesis
MRALVTRGLHPPQRDRVQTLPRADQPHHHVGRGCTSTVLTRPAIVFNVEPIGALDELEREWRCLEIDFSPSFFVSWDWIGTLLEMVPPESRPQLLRGTQSGRTVALALLGQTEVCRHWLVHARRWVLNATGDPVLDCIFLEHNGLLAGPHVGWDGLLEVFRAAKEVDEISLPGIAAPPPAALVEQRGLLRDEHPEASFAVELGSLAASGGDVATILSHNARSQLRRALRRLEPVTIEAASSTAEALEYFRILKELHIAWWDRRGEPHAFAHQFFECFHQRLIERTFDHGAVQLLRVQSGGRTIGILYNFRRGNRVYAYQSGFVHPEEHERPGVVAHALAIKLAWQQGAEIYDFMAGENRLKSSFGNRITTLSWTVVQKPRLLFRVEHQILGSSRRTTAGDRITSDRSRGDQPRQQAGVSRPLIGPEGVQVESP